MADYEYQHMRRVVYGQDDEYGKATFVPVCPNCFRFVAPDQTMRFGKDGITEAPNATCKRCGRVRMLFEGFLP